MNDLPNILKVLVLLLALGVFTAVAITMSQHASTLVSQMKRSL